MKKIYFIIAILAIGFAANAQRAAVPSSQVFPLHSSQSRVINDTLWWANQANDTAVDYVSVDTLGNPIGYVCGTDGYGDISKVEAFANATTPTVVYGAIYWFGYKHYLSNSTASKIHCRMYAMDGTGTNFTSTSAPAPGTVLTGVDITVAALDTSSMLSNAQVVMWNSPVFTANDFGVGFDLSNMNTADTIGFFSNFDGEGQGADMSWEQWSPGVWHSFLDTANWNLDLDLAIFPLVERNTSTGATPMIGGISLGFAGPNPTSDNTVVKYELANSAKNVVITIMDAQGKVVATEVRSNEAAGNYTYNVDGSNLATGIYFVQLQADKSRLAIKMVKQ